MMKNKNTDPISINTKINADGYLIRKKFDHLGHVALMKVIFAEDPDKTKDEVMDSLLGLRNMWVFNGTAKHKEKNKSI